MTGTTTNLSVAATDASNGTDLTYTWATVGTPPAPVTSAPQRHQRRAEDLGHVHRGGHVPVRRHGGRTRRTSRLRAWPALPWFRHRPSSSSPRHAVPGAGGRQRHAAIHGCVPGPVRQSMQPHRPGHLVVDHRHDHQQRPVRGPGGLRGRRKQRRGHRRPWATCRARPR